MTRSFRLACVALAATHIVASGAAAQVAPGPRSYGPSQYVEYVEGNAPIILSAPHGGYLEPTAIPNRSYGVTSQDRKTQELARRIASAMSERFGLMPHLVISHLHRKKLDPNRDIVEGAQGNHVAEAAWREYHGFLDAARAKVTQQWGQGLYLDIHGHGHPVDWVEIGYLLSATELAQSDATLRSNSSAQQSSIRALAARPNMDFPTLLRGAKSLGDFLSKNGFRAVPSPRDPHPGSNSYFNGGYSTERHGSRAGGTIDGIQLEHPLSLRADARPQRAYIDTLVDAVEAQFVAMRGMDLSAGPRISIFASEAHASEGGEVGVLRVARFGDSGARDVDLVISGSASPGSDYKALPSRLSFAAQETVKDLRVEAAADSLAEDWESVVVRLAPNAHNLDPSHAEVLIHDREGRADLELALACDVKGAATTPDASQHQRHARLLPSGSAGPRLTTGKYGSALAFDGQAARAEVTGLPWGQHGEVTVSFWFRGTPRGQSGFQYLLSVGAFGGAQSLHVWAVEATKVLRTSMIWDNALAQAGPLDIDVDVLDGLWHHYVLVARADGTHEVWLDSVCHAITQLAGQRFAPTAPMLLGQRENLDATRAFAGAFDEVRVSSHAFSETEIRDLFRWRRGRFFEHGLACAGSNGIPSLEQSGDADVGGPVDIRLRRGPAQGVAILCFGLSRTSWNSLPLPLPLDALGASGCNLYVSIDLSLGLGIDGRGEARIAWPVPFRADWIGAELNLQALVLDPAANTLGLTTSEGEAIVFGGLR